jgi:hypothetical protein
LLAGTTIALGGNTPPALPSSATAPYGMQFGAATTNQGAGWSVSDTPDLTGTGYDDILIGAPTVSGSPSTLGTASGGSVYLIFGSATVGTTAVTNWANTTISPYYVSNDRVGDLGQLGAATQQNPVSTTQLNFPFSGVTFTATGVDATSSFGASVSYVKLSSGSYGILIGAPNGPDANGANPGTGRAFLISGNFANYIGQTVNVDNPTAYSGLNIVTFVNSANPNGQAFKLGYSVAGGTNIFGDGQGDVILGSPGATVGTSTNGSLVPSQPGAVYALSAALLSGSTQTIDVSTIGQSGSQSAIFVGASPGDTAGFSVADAGDVNGATGTGGNIDDLLIGAPNNLSEGAAYLIYGGSGLASLATVTNNVRYISLSLIGATTSPTVPGATIQGSVASGETGWSVSAGGDFNGDGYADFLIGTPNGSPSDVTLGNSGEADLIYGAASGVSGVVQLGNLPATIQSASFTGANVGDMAGYAVSQVGVINAGQPTSILIGAPGFNSDSGTAYLIPGRAGLTGTYSLSTAVNDPLDALRFTNTTTGSAASTPFFGASLSGRIQGTQANTVDSDNEADFVIGAPGLDITQTAARYLAGGATVLESAFLPVPIPSENSIVAPIGIGGPTAPFSINATTPAALQIYVFPTTTSSGAVFAPATDINVATVKVNGVSFPTATIEADPDQANWVNGVPDAIITITPRSALNLANGTVTFVVSGQTLSTSPLPNENWSGTATVSVTGGSSQPVVSVGGGIATGPVTFTQYIPPFGPTTYVPSIAQLSALNYAPLPLAVALLQYQQPAGFRQRNYAYKHPGKHIGNSRGQTSPTAHVTNTLSSHVFDRSRFHAQKIYVWKPKVPKTKSKILNTIVPAQSTTVKYIDNQLNS